MRTVRTKVYKFDELSKDAQKVAIEQLWDINYEGWYEPIFEDAKEIGLEITSFDLDSASFVRDVKGQFITSSGECVEDILANHGNTCNTYLTAWRYKNSFQSTSDEVNEQELEDTEDAFLTDILADYKTMLQEQLEYSSSEEAIIETIVANDYEFTKDGKLFNK